MIAMTVLSAGLCVALVVPWDSSILGEETRSESSMSSTAQRQTAWPVADPSNLKIDFESLHALGDLVGGAGFIAHRGQAVYRWGQDHRPRYVASVMKGVISVLMLRALEQRLITSLDDAVVSVEPRLAELNDGTDAQITWHHLASMTSGYGLSEPPGRAFAYNDFAVALWYRCLMNGVYQQDGCDVLRNQLAQPLHFEDPVTFRALGANGPEPKLRISARDLARFGQMILDGGRVGDRRFLAADLCEKLTGMPAPADLPLAGSRPAAMLPGQRSAGGDKNLSSFGPGIYSFHFWLNEIGPDGSRMLPDAPEDTILASGKWGQSALWIIPSLDLVVAWNDSAIDDHHEAADDPNAEMNLAARLLISAFRSTEALAAK